MLSSECQSQAACPVAIKSHMNLDSTLSMIGNVSSDIGILMMAGENDSLIPVKQPFLLQQRLTEVNHPDHTLITYQNLGHLFAPSNQWHTTEGPVEPYVLADLYAWLKSHSGFTLSTFWANDDGVTPNVTTVIINKVTSIVVAAVITRILLWFIFFTRTQNM